jgi:hypothetical protein
MPPLEHANRYHETFERLSLDINYELRTDTQPCEAEPNGRIMIAACEEFLSMFEIIPTGTVAFDDRG